MRYPRLNRGAARIAALSGALALALTVAACGDDDGDGGDGNVGADDAVQVAHFVAHQANPYEQAHIEGVQAAADEGNAEVTLFDGANDPQNQTAQCQDAIATQQFDVFLIKAVAGPTMVACAEEAVDAGIKVIATDTPLGPDLNTTAAQVEGIDASVVVLPAGDADAHVELTAAACEGKDPCRIVYEFGPPEFTFAAEAREVFKQRINDEYPNIEIVAEGSHNFDPDQGFALTKQYMQQENGNIDVVVSDADPASLGIQRALDDLGVADKVIHIGGGGSEEGVGFVADGVWFGTSALVPRTMGNRAAELGIAAARGEELDETEIDVITDLSPVGGAITQENVKDFTPEWTLGAGG